MLERAGVEYRYRDYRHEPLSETEIRELSKLLDLPPSALLRRHDRVARELELHGDEDEGELVRLMARHPTLLQRPIGRLGSRAVVGRPAERLLTLLESPGGDIRP